MRDRRWASFLRIQPLQNVLHHCTRKKKKRKKKENKLIGERRARKGLEPTSVCVVAQLVQQSVPHAVIHLSAKKKKKQKGGLLDPVHLPPDRGYLDGQSSGVALQRLLQLDDAGGHIVGLALQHQQRKRHFLQTKSKEKKKKRRRSKAVNQKFLSKTPVALITVRSRWTTSRALSDAMPHRARSLPW
jgi:hypothetical protein